MKKRLGKIFHLHYLILLQYPCLGELLLLLRLKVGIPSINSGARALEWPLEPALGHDDIRPTSPMSA